MKTCHRSTSATFPRASRYLNGEEFDMRAILAAAVLIAVTGTASAGDVWLHLRVQENRLSTKRVAMNVPFGAASVLARQLPSSALEQCEIEFNDVSFTAADMQQIVRKLQTAPAGQAIDFRFRGGTMRAVRQNNVLVLQPQNWDGEMSLTEVRMPFRLAEVVVGTSNQRINLVRAVELLGSVGQGEILFARADDTQVRLWVDRDPSGASHPIGEVLP